MSTGREAEIFCKVLRKAKSGKVSLREDLKGRSASYIIFMRRTFLVSVKLRNSEEGREPRK